MTQATTHAIVEAWATYIQSRDRPDDWECEACRDECRERLEEEARERGRYSRYGRRGYGYDYDDDYEIDEDEVNDDDW